MPIRHQTPSPSPNQNPNPDPNSKLSPLHLDLHTFITPKTIPLNPNKPKDHKTIHPLNPTDPPPFPTQPSSTNQTPRIKPVVQLSVLELTLRPRPGLYMAFGTDLLYAVCM